MDNNEDYQDNVAELFKDKTIFITGGTGFIGKALIEKLLRCCTDLKKIYLLIREKKGKTPEERIRSIMADPLFDLLKKLKGDEIINKVETICGDIEVADLGISEDQREKLQNEVEIIYHCAACIRFDEPLKKAVYMNVKGTKFMLELAKECKKLQLLVHLSTAYCHLHERVLYEKIYPPPSDPHLILEAVDTQSEALIDQLTPKLLNNSPNTYVFTKALAETLVAEEMENLPAVIVRPSIVVPAWLEPFPGWTDNINGPAGILIAAGKGVIRTMYCNSDGYADFVPVDIAVNALLMIPFYLSKAETPNRVFNLTTSEEFKFTWNEIIDIGKNISLTKVPLNNVVWYPGGSMKKSKLLHKICLILFHLIPAIFVDALLIIFGFKPVLLHVQKRITKGFDMFEYFANNQWDFKSDVKFKLRGMMNPKEKKIYRMDGEGFDVSLYIENCVYCLRRFILKEPDETLPRARRHLKIMWFMDHFFKTIFFMGLIYTVWSKYIKDIFV